MTVWTQRTNQKIPAMGVPQTVRNETPGARLQATQVWRIAVATFCAFLAAGAASLPRPATPPNSAAVAVSR